VTRVVVLAIGHSTRSIGDFIHLLRAHCVRRVIDVRKIPRSDTVRSSIETNCLRRSIGLGFTTGTCQRVRDQ
jgi:uncharacterized protein (DUF488 family)